MAARDDREIAVLAAKIGELSQVCARLGRENAELRERVSWLTAGTPARAGRPVGAGPAPRPDQRAQRERPGEPRLSRRSAGKALGIAAAGVVGATALAEVAAGPAAASDGSGILAGRTTTAESATVVQFDGTSAPGMIFLVNDTSFGAGGSSHPAALGGWAGGDVANGIYGFTEVEGGDAVVGQVGFGNSTGNGVHGIAAGSAVVGILAENSAGTAVAATCDSVGANATAIVGTMTSTTPGNLSAAVRGVNNGTDGNGIGVWGSHAGSGWGVNGTSASGVGVKATATGTGGRGGVFTGVAAQVQLSPGLKATHPTSGSRGDLYADSTGRLWFCKTSGSTATWHQIA
jgi:hypothetical protein